MKYYFTTPLYYVNAAPHIGHTYTTLAADTIKRFRQMLGDDVFLTTGTDEHGQKVERSALAAGKTPEEFADAVSAEFRRQWDTLGLQVRLRSSAPPIRNITKRCSGCFNAAWTTASSIKAVTPASTASSMNCM